VSKKTRDTAEKPARGRRAGDPGARRSYRYVMRMHPDLADGLNKLADESGLSRSLFVERILISFVNQDPRMALDHIGRRVRHDIPPTPVPPGSLASFGRQWQRWSALRHDVLGEESYDTSPVFDEYGRDKEGHGQHREPRPPVPKRMLAPDFGKPDKIHPHRGGGRKK
jgi:hypothetical protein